MGNKLAKFKKQTQPFSALNEPILDKSHNQYPEYIELEDRLPSNRVIFGCRSPQSKGAGNWDGAFVYINQNSTKLTIIYDNNMEYVSKNIPLEKAIKIYNEYINHNWIDMSEEDILKTAKMKCI